MQHRERTMAIPFFPWHQFAFGHSVQTLFYLSLSHTETNTSKTDTLVARDVWRHTHTHTHSGKCTNIRSVGNIDFLFGITKR